jgi:hypothetical protein
MRIRFTERVVIAAGALAILSILPASATNTSQLVGHWHGLGQSETDGRFIIPCVDEILPGVNNRFKANVEVQLEHDDGEIVPCVFPVDLALSEGGVITGSGIHIDPEHEIGHRLLIHGKVREMGDGSVRIAAFSYKIFQKHGGLLDEGHMALFQMVAGDSNPNVSTYRLGSYTPEDERLGGALEAELQSGRTPATLIGGTIRFGTPPEPVLPALLFDVAGTLGPEVEGAPSAFAVIGVTNLGQPPDPVQPTGFIAILIGESNPPEPVEPSESNPPEPVRGTYQLYESFSAVYTAVFHGTDLSFDHGSFDLPAVPPPAP